MNPTFTTLGKLPNTFTRALTLLLLSALMSVSSLYGQTYLSQDFEAAWVGNNPSAPGAGSIPAVQN